MTFGKVAALFSPTKYLEECLLEWEDEHLMQVDSSAPLLRMPKRKIGALEKVDADLLGANNAVKHTFC